MAAHAAAYCGSDLADGDAITRTVAQDRRQILAGIDYPRQNAGGSEFLRHR